MKLKVPVTLIKKIEKHPKFQGEKHEDMLAHLGRSYSSFREDPDDVATVNSNELTQEALDMLMGWLKDPLKYKGGKFLKSQLNAWIKIKDNPDTVVVKSLRNLEPTLIEYMKKAPEYLLFEKHQGNFYPNLVTNIEYHEQKKDTSGYYTPAYVDINTRYISMGKNETKQITFSSGDLKGGETVKTLLDKEGWYIGNDKLIGDYTKEIKTFQKYKSQIGAQFLGVGSATEVAESKWNNRTVTLAVEGVRDKLIIDTDPDQEDLNETSCVRFIDGTNEDNTFSVPTHPIIYVFNLNTHTFMKLHVNNLEPYVYNPKLIEKLILPKGNKDLINILVEGTGDIMEDIIEGKTGGIIIMATGAPGVGKTLTAEVYSEFVERPLYIVQCSQLGIELDDLEENLKKVLARADRWRAILLIDEADVYVHTRGDDIHQNAVVGVFLRVLEYYRGILFMTSNRGTIIDDAIMSRCTAHVRYEMPTPEALTKIWRILSDQFNAEITDEVIKDIVQELPQISGRDVKNLTKLAKLMARRQGKEIDVSLIKYVSQFLDLAQNGVEEK